MTTPPATLFCFPYAGGDTPIYHGWRKALAPFVRVHAVQLPGRGRLLAQPPLCSMDSAVDYLLDTLPLGDAGAIFLFGHSMGALLAFELTRALHRQESKVAHLFLSACQAPSSPRSRASIHDLDDEIFKMELRRLGGTPEDVLGNDELMSVLLPTLRADFQLCETYHYISDAPLAVPITAFAGTDDEDHSPSSMAAWQKNSGGDFRLHALEGDHFFIHSATEELMRHISGQVLATQRSSIMSLSAPSLSTTTYSLICPKSA